MELQNKFGEILNNNGKLGYNDILAKQCTILCLEEQIKLLFWCIKETKYPDQYLYDKVEELQQQLKLLKDV